MLPAIQSSAATATLLPATQDLPEPPIVRSSKGIASVSLTAQINPADGEPEFVYNGEEGVAPTIEVSPGDTIAVDVADDLPTVPPPMAQRGDANGPDIEMTPTGDADDMNLHFHGLTVSPRKPGDDVLGMLAQPGQSLQYVVHVPKNAEPGLYWYHPHVHGFTNFQVGESGMSGAIVVDGLERHVRGLASMKQRLIIVRATGIGGEVPARKAPGSNTHPCGTKDGLTTSLNGAVTPVIAIAPGERQFLRLVNATGHRTLNLAIDGGTFELVAYDGYALDTYPGNPPTQKLKTIVVPPAGRAEFVVTGPSSGQTKLRTLCFDTGPNGDPDPPLVLATLTALKHSKTYAPVQALHAGTPFPSNAYDSPLPPPAAVRTVVLSERGREFFINGKAYRMGAPPMFVVHVGTVEEWHILNVSREVHDFHIHQMHFLVERIDGTVQQHPFWRDSVVVPHERGAEGPGAVTLLMDFRDPVIRGEFMFHCHILDHEDHGMMANIRAI
jgi:FtsP/CotA-like multicopper oxidase with cupredoxin domain